MASQSLDVIERVVSTPISKATVLNRDPNECKAENTAKRMQIGCVVDEGDGQQSIDDSKDDVDHAGQTQYSVFTIWEKRMIVVASSIASFVGPLTANIYLPALHAVATDLHTSDSAVNLSVTVYLVSIKLFTIYYFSYRETP